MKKNIKFVVLLVFLVLFGILIRWTPLSNYFSKEHLLGYLQSIRGMWWGPLAFTVIYSLACVMAFPGSILTLAGGAVFGAWRGTLYNVVASNIGASLAFFVARYLGRDFIQGFLKGKSLAKFDDAIGKAGFKTIFRLRLIPLVPFNGLNFGAGLSAVSYRDYLFGSLLGMLPATFIYTYFADALIQGVEGSQEEAYVQLVIAGALLILISFLPAIYRRIK